MHRAQNGVAVKSYDYAKRRGVRAISWSRFASYAAQLTVALEQAGVEMVVSDELIVFPWDRRVRVDKKWQLHPDLISALAAQRLSELPE
jgi:hypothetical protein